MKKLFFTIAVMLLGFAATAQNSGDNNGNNGGSDPDMVINSNWRTNGNDLTQAGSDPFIGSTSAHPLRLKSNDTLRMFIDTTGYVGIGTNHPKAKLSVDGMVLAKSIKVSTDAVYWPDFVFSPEHKRMSLGDLETYITANHHLPGVPSAAEVKEQEGVILEEMNAILLQKVEELTLYVIELQKRIEVLEHKE